MRAHIYQTSQNASKRVWIEAFPSSLVPSYQHPGNLLIRVLSWSLFSERGAGELSAGNTRSKANKSNSRKGGGGGYRVEQRSRPTWRVPYLRRPRLPGFFLMTSPWMGSWTALPARYFLHELITGGTSHNGSRQVTKSQTQLKLFSMHTHKRSHTTLQFLPLYEIILIIWQSEN